MLTATLTTPPTLHGAAASFSRGEKPLREAQVSIKDMMKGHKTAPPSSRDFVTENAISAILASPRSKQRKEEENWLASKNFAKKPAYLERIKQQLAAEKQYVLELADAQQRDAASHASGGAVREMGDDERAELLQQLKTKWSEVSKVRVQPLASHCGGGKAVCCLLRSVSPPSPHRSLPHVTSLCHSTHHAHADLGCCSATAFLRTRKSPPLAPPWAKSASRRTARRSWTSLRRTSTG